MSLPGAFTAARRPRLTKPRGPQAVCDRGGRASDTASIAVSPMGILDASHALAGKERHAKSLPGEKASRARRMDGRLSVRGRAAISFCSPANVSARTNGARQAASSRMTGGEEGCDARDTDTGMFSIIQAAGQSAGGGEGCIFHFSK